MHKGVHKHVVEEERRSGITDTKGEEEELSWTLGRAKLPRVQGLE